MIKKRLVEFINKYNVAKNEQVIIDSKNNTLIVESKPTEVGGLRIYVELKQSEIEDGGFGILETKRFKSMLSVLGDDVTASLNSDSGNVTSIKFKDKTNKEVNVVTADLSVLDTTPPIKGLPDQFPVIIPITEDLVKDFNTSVTALGVKLFSVSPFKNLEDVEFLFGYREKINTDVIKLPLKDVIKNSKFNDECKGTFNENVYFDAETFLEILNVNKDMMLNGKLSFCEDMAIMEYENSDFKCQYLLVAAEV